MESKPIFKIVKPGVYASFQDKQRLGFGAIGVPSSGPMDSLSHAYVNQVLKNNLSDPEMEIYGSGLELEVLSKLKAMVAGANIDIKINGQSAVFNKALKLNKGEILSFGKLNLGVWTYLGIKGGFSATKILYSTSPLKGSPIRAFQKGDVIYGYSVIIEENEKFKKIGPTIIDYNQKINVIPGPEFDLLDIESKVRLESETFIITPDSNRMGYRLSGPKLSIKQDIDMLTSAVLPSTVQLLPSGQLIVLMKDCQPTGGYPRILTIQKSSMAQFAQRPPSCKLRFNLNMV